MFLPERPAVIVTADDFGLSPAVNEAVEQAHRHGILTGASLMVAAGAAEDAVARARRMPTLAVGLHLVLVEGPAVLSPAEIPLLVDAEGEFSGDQARLGFRYAFVPGIRRQLAVEIRAQFEAFRRTGLCLDHVNAHKHMHLHPLIGPMLIAIGRDFGLRAMRIPAERGAGAGLALWCRLLRRRARRAGLLTNDRVIGLARSGRMTADYVRPLLADPAPGTTEFYFHPATATDAVLARTMPTYRHAAELAALLALRPPAHARLTTYGALTS